MLAYLFTHMTFNTCHNFLNLNTMLNLATFTYPIKNVEKTRWD